MYTETAMAAIAAKFERTTARLDRLLKAGAITSRQHEEMLQAARESRRESEKMIANRERTRNGE